MPEDILNRLSMTLSIIIPFKDRAPLVQRMLESLAKCAEMPDELIFVDNGSHDEARNLVREFVSQTMEQHSECHVDYLCKPSGGACAARNAGLKAAKGEWIYFFDSDDEISPEFITDAKNFIRNHEGLDLIGIRTNVFAYGEETPRTCTFTTSAEDQILCALLATQSMLFKRSFLEKIGGWNEELPKWNDWELGLRALLGKPRMKWIKNRTYHRIYVHEDSITGKDFSSTFKDISPTLTETARLVANTRQNRLQRAWAYRTAILAGHIAHEGNKQLGKHVLTMAYHTLKSTSVHNPLHLFIAKLLYRYTAHGKHGAWRLARFLIKI